MSHEKGLKEVDIKSLLAEEVGRLMKDAATNKKEDASAPPAPTKDAEKK